MGWPFGSEGRAMPLSLTLVEFIPIPSNLIARWMRRSRSSLALLVDNVEIFLKMVEIDIFYGISIE